MENDMSVYTYEIFDDGYDIFRDGMLIISQREPLTNVFIKNGSYEDNAKAQIDRIINPPEPEPLPPTQEELLRGDVDYIALMEDLDLPSYNEEEGE